MFREKIRTTQQRKILPFWHWTIFMFYFPEGHIYKTGKRTIYCNFVGPRVIYRTISIIQFILMILDGIISHTSLKKEEAH